MQPDVINGLFEFCGAVLLALDVLRLRRDREVRGIHWGARGFFTAWGIWNLYYYPAIDQWWSFAGGCALVAVNAVWLAQLYVYSRARGH